MISSTIALMDQEGECDHWQAIRGAIADRMFDAGEFSDSFDREEPPNPCGKCATCVQAAKEEAEEEAKFPGLRAWLEEQREP